MLRSAHEAIDAATMIHDEELALLVHSEGGDLERGIGQLAMPERALAVVFHSPDPAARVVSVNVGAVQLGKLASPVDDAAGERPELGVMMLDGGRHVRRGALLSVEIERVAALEDAPAVVFAGPHEMRRFPEVLPVVPHPDLSALGIDAHSPRVAQPVGPYLRARPGHLHERVVRRHRVAQRIRAVVDIDPEHAPEKIVERLSGVPAVRIARAVARRDIEHALGPKRDIAPVVSRGPPLDDDLLGAWRYRPGRTAIHHEAGDAIAPLRFSSVPV